MSSSFETVQVAVALPPSLVQIGVTKLLTQANIPFIDVDRLATRVHLLNVCVVLTDLEGMEHLRSHVPPSIRMMVLADEHPDGLSSQVRVISPLENPSTIITQLTSFADLKPTNPVLTKREREMLTLVAQGFQNNEIGERCFVALATVKSHLQNAFRKLGARDRASAVYRASQMGLLP
jgi:DNA-binding NarL/FixJ family response regulator